MNELTADWSPTILRAALKSLEVTRKLLDELGERHRLEERQAKQVVVGLVRQLDKDAMAKLLAEALSIYPPDSERLRIILKETVSDA